MIATVRAWDSSAVDAFDSGPGDILVMERGRSSQIGRAVALARVGEHRSVVTFDNAVQQATTALLSLGVDCPGLADDIAEVVHSFLTQFGMLSAPMRVEVVDRANCPKFHCDTLRMRLVTALCGPGTEYIHTDAPNEIQRAPTGAFVFLKGHHHPFYADRVHHRSPQLSAGERRLCVVLDVSGEDQ